MFIFMNVVVVFNDIFAADSEDESEHFTKETFFKEKITDVNFAFYLKIKHFFPENIDLYNKNDWRNWQKISMVSIASTRRKGVMHYVKFLYAFEREIRSIATTLNV
jgi:hypothetical protein